MGTHQVCYCHRCTALYTTVAVVGLVYALIRWRRPLPTRVLLWGAVPMLIDGFWHMVADIVPTLGLRSAASDPASLNFWVRMATGVLLGAAAVLWAYPRFEQEFARV